ncbi:MAG: ABC transporter permease, partial [Mesorhizobium sp.]
MVTRAIDSRDTVPAVAADDRRRWFRGQAFWLVAPALLLLVIC